MRINDALPDLTCNEINEILAGLSDRDREVCEYLKHHSITETATRMGVCYNTIVNRLAHIRKHVTSIINK